MDAIGFLAADAHADVAAVIGIPTALRVATRAIIAITVRITRLRRVIIAIIITAIVVIAVVIITIVVAIVVARRDRGTRSEEHMSELQSLMRISYAVFCLKNKHTTTTTN